MQIAHEVEAVLLSFDRRLHDDPLQRLQRLQRPHSACSSRRSHLSRSAHGTRAQRLCGESDRDVDIGRGHDVQPRGAAAVPVLDHQPAPAACESAHPGGVRGQDGRGSGHARRGEHPGHAGLVHRGARGASGQARHERPEPADLLPEAACERIELEVVDGQEQVGAQGPHEVQHRLGVFGARDGRDDERAVGGVRGGAPRIRVRRDDGPGHTERPEGLPEPAHQIDAAPRGADDDADLLGRPHDCSCSAR